MRLEQRQQSEIIKRERGCGWSGQDIWAFWSMMDFGFSLSTAGFKVERDGAVGRGGHAGEGGQAEGRAIWVSAVIQMRDSSGLEQGLNGRDGEKWSDAKYR